METWKLSAESYFYIWSPFEANIQVCELVSLSQSQRKHSFMQSPMKSEPCLTLTY